MPTINNLSSVDSLASGDQFPIYDASNGDARKVSASALLTFFENNFANPEFTTQTLAPTSSGFQADITESTDNMWLILNPTGAFAAGTVTLPGSPVDGQQIIVTCSDSVTALSVIARGGETVVGAPTSLGVGGFFSLRYDNGTSPAWWCTSQSLGATDTFDTITIETAVLDANGAETITFGQEGVGTAVNNVAIFNATTGNGPGIAAVGSDTNIDVDIVPKGSGVVLVDGVQAADLSSSQTLTNKTLDSATTVVNGYLRQSVYLVGITLPAASVGLLGARAFVTNSSVTTFNSIVAGGGANGVPVFCDGTDWRVG
jgi:hypothetical protein